VHLGAVPSRALCDDLIQYAERLECPQSGSGHGDSCTIDTPAGIDFDQIDGDARFAHLNGAGHARHATANDQYLADFGHWDSPNSRFLNALR